jgi:hypothetical protein
MTRRPGLLSGDLVEALGHQPDVQNAGVPGLVRLPQRLDTALAVRDDVEDDSVAQRTWGSLSAVGRGRAPTSVGRSCSWVVKIKVF